MRVGVRAGWAVVAAAVLAAALGLTATSASAQQGPPAKPTGLEATETAHDSVTLGWDDPDGDTISGYRILRRDLVNQPAGTFTTVAQDTESAGTSFVDDTVEPETRYAYRIVALNNAGASRKSMYVNVTTPAVPLPAKPTGLEATEVAHDSVALGWDDPDDDSPSGYRILRRDIANQPAGTFTTVAEDTDSADLSFLDTAVEPETLYAYRIVALNAAGASARSMYVKVTTPAVPIPAQPTGLEATEVFHDSVALGWDDPDDDSPSGYRILRRDVANQAAGTFITLADDTATADTSYTDTTVEPDTHYAYRVIAINETGSSPRSLNVSLTTLPAPRLTEQTDEPAKLNGFGIDGTDDVDVDPEVRAAQTEPHEITMELPEGCVLHELDSGGHKPWHTPGHTPWMLTNDECAAVDQPDPPDDQVVAQYFRLAVAAESTVTLRVVGPNSYQLNLRSADGTLVAHDAAGPDVRPYHFYQASLSEVLEPGVYVVEVARQLDLYGHLGFVLVYEGDHIHTGDSIRLSDLEISDVNLTDFNPYTADYARNVAADVDTVTVTPTPASSHTTVSFGHSDADIDLAGHQVNLDADGETEITVTVASSIVPRLETAYRITLTELAGTTSPLSADASLSALSIDNIDFGSLSSETTEYSYVLGFYGALNGLLTTMTPTTAHSGATWESNRPDAKTGIDGYQISLSGSETVTVTVTSQDGAIRRTYTLAPSSSLRRDPTKDVHDVSYASGLWSDGEQFITTKPIDAQDKEFALYRVESPQFVEQFEMWAPPEFQCWINRGLPSGVVSTWWSRESLWSDGETLWVTYLNNDDVAYAYNLNARQRDPDRDIALTNRPGRATSEESYFSGMWSDGETLYVHGSNYLDRRLYRYDLATGEYLGWQQLQFWFGSASFVEGMWSDGKTLWVPTTRGAAAAYDLQTLEHLPGLSLSAACGYVVGLWSDGHTMWALSTCGTIEAFTLPENARLKTLSLDAGTFGLFNNGIFDYQAEVPAGTTTVTVTAERAFGGGSSAVEFSMDDADDVADGHQVSLTPGIDTTLTIAVTAPNGVDTETYTIEITESD